MIMLKRILFIIPLLAVMAVWFVPGQASAKNIIFKPTIEIPGLFPTNEEKAAGGVTVNENMAGHYIRAVYIYAVGIVGVVAVVMIMYAGFLWITAAGDSGKINQAKEQMNGAVIGTILMLTSYLLLRLINPDLVVLRFPFINPVSTIVQSTHWCADLPAGAFVESGTGAGPFANECGVKYQVTQTSGAIAKQDCLGNKCPDPSRICAPQKQGSGYGCFTAEDACENQRPDGTDVADWCPFIDKIIAANPAISTKACRNADKRYKIDNCVYDDLLKCPANQVRIDCNAGITADRTATVCWDNNQPRVIDVPMSKYRRVCRQTIDDRAIIGPDTICCRVAKADDVVCDENRIGYTIEVPCAAVGKPECKTKCWALQYLRFANAQFDIMLNGWP